MCAKYWEVERKMATSSKHISLFGLTIPLMEKGEGDVPDGDAWPLLP